METWDVMWFDENGENAYYVEMTPEQGKRIRAKLAQFEKNGVIHSFTCAPVRPEMGYKEFVEEVFETLLPS